MKLKRTVQDALAHACQANVASQLMHYPELQAYRPGPYPRYHSAAVAAAEGPSAASYVHPHGLQYSSPLPSVSSLPLDSFYQYSSLPGVMLPSTTPQLMGSFPSYHQYYWYQPGPMSLRCHFHLRCETKWDWIDWLSITSSYPNRIDAVNLESGTNGVLCNIDVICVCIWCKVWIYLNLIFKRLS